MTVAMEKLAEGALVCRKFLVAVVTKPDKRNAKILFLLPQDRLHALRLDWPQDRYTYLPGLVSAIDRSPQIITFAHSLIGFDLKSVPHRSVRLIRDPRDVWLSGYLYHRHCTEPWCVNERFDTTPPILFPRVPFSQQHRSEEWKRSYLASLNSVSYQRNLLTRDNDAGLAFEMDHYADWTVRAMASWQPDSDTIDIKLEDFMADFDGTLITILRHFGISEIDIPGVLKAAASADINRMSDARIKINPHIHSRSISKWRDMLTSKQIATFEARYGNAINALGYPLSS
jgi:hypothetical protein